MITLEISFGAFVGLGVFAGIVVLGVAGGLTIRNKLRNVSRQLFGTESIVDGLNRQADIAAETPKSVSGMTRLMEPQMNHRLCVIFLILTGRSLNTGRKIC